MVPFSCERRNNLRFERVRYSLRPMALLMAKTAMHIIRIKARRYPVLSSCSRKKYCSSAAIYGRHTACLLLQG